MQQQLDIALHFLRLGNTPAAIDALRELLADEPDNSDAHAVLSQALLSQLRVEAATHEASLALQLDPNSSLAHYSMANCQLLNAQPVKALDAANQAVELEPLDHQNHLLKARCHARLEQKEQAKQSLDEAIRIAPESPKALVALGSHYLDNGDTPKAGELALAALAANAGDSDAHLLMGRVKLRNGDSQGAKEHAVFAIQQSPDDTEALVLIAEIKASENKLLGIWYKFNTFMSTLSSTKQIAWLIGAYVFFNLCSQLLRDFGFPTASTVTSFLWLFLVIYSWVGIPYFKRLINKEISKVRLSPDF